MIGVPNDQNACRPWIGNRGAALLHPANDLASEIREQEDPMEKTGMNAQHADSREKENRKRQELLTMEPAGMILKSLINGCIMGGKEFESRHFI